MTLRKHVFMALALFLGLALAQAQPPTIDASNWPYGSDQIGNHWSYYNTSANVAVNIATINPYQQGGSWNFATGPTDVTATSEIRTVAAAPGPAPANTTYTEYQTASGQTQWLYEDENAQGTWARGFWQQGTIYPYDAPQWNIYRYPMTYATTWSPSWTWGEAELGVPVQETRSNEIVGWGTVTVPHGGPLPCLVIRTLQTTYAEFMGIPLIDDSYRLYEWIVPGIGSVCTIQSVNHEVNWYFNTAAGFYRLFNSNLGGDLVAPTISNVTQLTDTPFPGPYSVRATITDASGIDSARIYYSIAGGAWTAGNPVSIIGDTFSFQIPHLNGSPIQQVRYYVWAKDASTNHNRATSPANAPTSFYSFNWIFDNVPPAFANVTVWPSPTYFNGPYPVQATITDDNGVLFASLHYKFGSAPWEEATADSNVGAVYHFTIPGIAATTIIRYYLEAVDNSGFFNTGYHPAAGQSGPIVFQAVYTVPRPPRAVSDLVIRPSLSDVVLYWSPVTQDTSGNPITVSYYNVLRGLQGDGSDLALIDTSQATSYTDVGAIANSAKYFYNVRAVRQ